MAWSKIKRAINSTIGTDEFKPLDEIVRDSFDRVVTAQNELKTSLETGENNFIVSSARGDVEIETGSYRGTGTYGHSNPNTLTFSFEPKFVHIVCANGAAGPGDRLAQEITLVRDCPAAYIGVRENATFDGDADNIPAWHLLYVSWNENSVSWYCNYNSFSPWAEYAQLNALGNTFYYVAIG